MLWVRFIKQENTSKVKGAYMHELIGTPSEQHLKDIEKFRNQKPYKDLMELIRGINERAVKRVVGK